MNTLERIRRLVAMQFVLAVLFLFGLLVFQSCIGKQSSSPQNQLITMYDIYNAQYASYMTTTGYVIEDGQWIKKKTYNLSDEQKMILREKKKILVKVYPLIRVYDSLVGSGGKVPPDLQVRIMTLLDSLIIKTL